MPFDDTLINQERDAPLLDADRKRYSVPAHAHPVQQAVANTVATAMGAERRLAVERATSELRERFIAVLGHDLRNPLAGIEAGLRHIELKGTTDVAPAVLELMLDSVGRMKGLIDDVLDLTHSRLGGGIPLHIARGRALGPTLKQIVDELQVAHPERVIIRRFDLPNPVDCDHGRLGQLLSNLLANALTHGAKDLPILVEAETQHGEFRLSVANAGDPIPSAAMERLFQPFYRGEIRSSPQGLGLGLYIASQVARAHGGTLSATSDSDQTIFTFVMPVAHHELGRDGDEATRHQQSPLNISRE